MAFDGLAIVDRAIIFATEAHTGQSRKGTKIPYILHPLEAAEIVSTMTDDMEIIAAAILHDVIEDAHIQADALAEIFGERVASLVSSESENKRENRPAEETWKVRKTEFLQKLADESLDAKMIALGDKLSNIRATSRDYEALGDKLWQRFNQKDPKQHAWYYKSLTTALSELSSYSAYREYLGLVLKVFG